MIRNETGPDAGAVWHYGDPLREQRALLAGAATVDLSHRPVVSVTGRDRLGWLHSLTSQYLTDLQPGVPVTAFILDPNGRIEHVLYGVDDGETFWFHTEPGHAEALVTWLDRMRFAMRVEVADRSADKGVVWAPRQAGDPVVLRSCTIVDRDALDAVLGAQRAGTWAFEALRIAAGEPRVFLDTDERTIPNELGMPHGVALGDGVHLQKGCYRGQETVARVYTLGRPPRRLTLLHLDGSVDALPEPGAELTLDGRAVGRVGSSGRHHELGPVALGLVKRSIPIDAELLAGGIAAAQEMLVDPEVGEHIRPRLG